MGQLLMVDLQIEYKFSPLGVSLHLGTLRGGGSLNVALNDIIDCLNERLKPDWLTRDRLGNDCLMDGPTIERFSRLRRNGLLLFRLDVNPNT